MLQAIDLSIHGTRGEALRSFHLDLRPGEVHVVTGPRAGGRCLLFSFLSGRRRDAVDGDVIFDGSRFDPRRAQELGVFLPPAPPAGFVGNARDYLRQAWNRYRRERGRPRVSNGEFRAACDRAQWRLAYAPLVLLRDLDTCPDSIGWKQVLLLLIELTQARLVLLSERDVAGTPEAMAALALGIRLVRSSDRAFLVSTRERWFAANLDADEWHELRGGLAYRPLVHDFGG